MVQIHITRASNATLNNNEHWLTYIQPVTYRTDVMLNLENEPIHAFFGTSRPRTNLLWLRCLRKSFFGCGKQGAIRTQNTALLTIANSGFILAFIPVYICIFFAFMSSSLREQLVMTKFYIFWRTPNSTMHDN